MASAESVREFFRRCPARIIGITGSRNEGSVSGLVARILSEAGKKVWLRSAGQSPMDILSDIKASDLVILELSSDQLMELDLSPHIAVCLAIASEDLDTHINMRQYIAAKGNLFWHQQPGDVAIYDARNDFSTQIAQLSQGRKIPYLKAPGAQFVNGGLMMAGRPIELAEAGRPAPREAETICAAVTVAWEILGDRPEPIKRAVMSFLHATADGRRG